MWWRVGQWRGRGVLPVARRADRGHLPMALFAPTNQHSHIPTVETRAITPGPAVKGALQPTVPFVFERSAAASLGIGGTLPGRLAFPESQMAGGGAGRSSAPQRDFGATRTGWDSPISGPQLYAHMLSEVCEVCGVPGALVNPASAGPAGS